MAGQTPRQSARVRHMLHRASRDQGQGRVEIFSAHNSGQLVEVGRRFADIARTVAGGTAPCSPLNTTVSGNRRFTVASRPLADYRLVRARYDCDVNDVVLAVVAGALRNWLLLSRGEPATPTSTVRGHGPDVGVSRHRTRLDRARSGHRRGVAVLATFPSGKATPWCGCRRSRMPPNRTRPRPASSTPGPSSRLLGFAPPTLHAMGIRIATSFSARLFNLFITNVPGAQKQMYVAGTKLLETYAVPPLLPNQVLAIGVTSYNRMLYLGVNADREAMSDLDVPPSLLRESLDELLEAAQ